MSRRGFVLPTVLFAVLVLAALIGGTWAAALQSVHSARLAEGALRARSAAMSAVAALLAAWDAPSLDSMTAGTPENRVAAGSGVAVAVEVRRTGGDYYAITATAVDSATGARRAVASFARLEPLLPEPRSVLRLRVDPGPSAAARIVGRDSQPSGWSCPASNDSITTLIVQSQTSDSAFWSLAPQWTWERLVAWSGLVAGGGDSLPLAHVSGDLVVNGGRRLGFFLVEGDVRIGGGAELVGIVLAKGSIVFEGLGGSLLGSAVGRELRVDPLTPLAAVRLGHSQCVLRLVGRARAPGKPVAWGSTVDWFR